MSRPSQTGVPAACSAGLGCRDCRIPAASAAAEYLVVAGYSAAGEPTAVRTEADEIPEHPEARPKESCRKPRSESSPGKDAIGQVSLVSWKVLRHSNSLLTDSLK